jgi:hypothetical protein
VDASRTNSVASRARALSGIPIPEIVVSMRCDRQHHLSPTPLQAPRERLRRRSERKDLDGRGTQIAAVHEPRERAELVAIRLDDEVHASVGGLRHRDQSSAGAQHGAGATQPLAPDGVEDDVDGFHGVLEALRRVDHVVCADFADDIPVRRGCGPDHVGAGRARELHREAADVARGPVDQHALVCAEPAVVE